MVIEPRKIDHPLYKLLQDEDIKGFNELRAKGEICDFSFAILRGLDLRGMDARGLNLSGAYFRGADLRGIDFRQTNLEGASICEAKISGVFFPDALDAHEIYLSVERGTRMRYRPANS